MVDVVVTDKQGQSVTGLRKDDFHLSEDGGPQIVTSFEEHKGAAPNEFKLPPMPPNVFTNFPTARDADSGGRNVCRLVTRSFEASRYRSVGL